jgi:hypothetical protein
LLGVVCLRTKDKIPLSLLSPVSWSWLPPGASISSFQVGGAQSYDDDPAFFLFLFPLVFSFFFLVLTFAS